MTWTTRSWRAIALVALTLAAFLLGRGGAAPAEARSLLLQASHIGTNEDGDVLWVYDFDGANREWVVTRVDYQRGAAETKVIDHPRSSVLR